MVYLVTDVSDRDRFGRLLRYVYVGEDFINEEMVESGLAIAREYRPDIAHTDDLEAAQAEPRQSDRGQWAYHHNHSPDHHYYRRSDDHDDSAAPPPRPWRHTTTTASPTTTTAPPASNCHSCYQGSCLIGRPRRLRLCWRGRQWTQLREGSDFGRRVGRIRSRPGQRRHRLRVIASLVAQ